MNIDTLSDASLRLFGSRRFAPEVSPEPPSWLGAAACAGVGTDLFYIDTSGFVADAKLICSRCPVRRECLEEAMRLEPASHHFRHGIWGGLGPHERAELSASGWSPGDPLPPVRGASRDGCEKCGKWVPRKGSHRCDPKAAA